MSHPLEVPPDALRLTCDPAALSFETTEEVAPVIGTVGQDRALDALDFGLEIGTTGYNLFVAGIPGSGRATTVLSRIEQLAKTLPTPGDWCYVHNFRDAYRPQALELPPGMGDKLATDMNNLIAACRREIPRVFQSDAYQQRRQQLLTELDRQRDHLFHELDDEARQRGLTVQIGPAGVVTIPLTPEGRPMTPEEYQGLQESVRERLRALGEEFQERLVTFLKRIRDAEQETAQAVRTLDRESALFAVGHLVQDLAEQYSQQRQVVSYLEAVQEDVVDNLQNFRPEPEESQQRLLPGLPAMRTEDPFNRYKVNVLVSHNGSPGAPVVVEHNPTFQNVIGRVDYQPAFGTMSTDFRLIKPGALHRANGGFLILQARDVLINPYCWEALKRALDCKEIVIENLGDMLSALPMLTLRPDAIPLNVKVVLIGNPMVYNLLYHMDEEFLKLFKVKADFDIEMERSTDNVGIYAGFVRARVEQDNLLHFHRSGVAKVVEHGSRLLEHQGKLSTRFLDVADLISEASYWAKKAGSGYVHKEHVEQAIAQKEFRSGLVRDKVQRVIQEDVIKIATEGQAVGQINGLSVLDIGDYVFGTPSRITAAVSLGSAGVLNVEREIELSGKIHSKGVMILSGYLAAKYAQDKPLSLSASLTFEQLYNEVDGDSASSAELYCLLSALAELPLRQDLAVTGSVNQKGEVQAVGGVQYKIEGFFDACRARGLTGSQGVLIPASNVRHLMLREVVVEAVRQGQFHVYAVSTVDEGIELLTGRPAGQVQPDGAYPEGSVNYLVNQRLLEYAERLRSFGKAPEGEGDEAADG
ncbi:MAG: AAA family ATPase [Chloroflexi bacterium]|nr:AAA family ATPase [Chloroflexota bacterium]